MPSNHSESGLTFRGATVPEIQSNFFDILVGIIGQVIPVTIPQYKSSLAYSAILAISDKRQPFNNRCLAGSRSVGHC